MFVQGTWAVPGPQGFAALWTFRRTPDTDRPCIQHICCQAPKPTDTMQNNGAALNKTQALNVCNIIHLYSEMKVTPGLVPGLIIYNVIQFLQRVQRSSSSIRSSALYINLTTKLFLITQHQEMLTRLGFCRNLRDELCCLVGKQGQASVLQLRQAHLGTWGTTKHLKELLSETTTGKSSQGTPERKTSNATARCAVGITTADPLGNNTASQENV